MAGCSSGGKAKGADAEDMAAAGLRLRARTDEVTRLKSRLKTSGGSNRRAINAALDDLEEFRTVAEVKLEVFRAADEKNRPSARSDFESALKDLEASLAETQKRFP